MYRKYFYCSYSYVFKKIDIKYLFIGDTVHDTLFNPRPLINGEYRILSLKMFEKYFS